MKITESHTEQCLQKMDKRNQLITDYITRWPDYCHHCSGSGVYSWFKNQAPLGSGYYWPEWFEEACPKCEGVCPRCGTEIDYAKWEDFPFEGQCDNCNWTRECSICPEPYECECWAERIDS